MKKLFMIVLFVVAALAVAHVGDANAATTCTASGKIVYASSSTGLTYVYIGAGPQLITTVYMFTTNSTLMQSLAVAAFSGGYWVSVSGSVPTTCPTAGTIRNYGTMVSIGAMRNY